MYRGETWHWPKPYLLRIAPVPPQREWNTLTWLTSQYHFFFGYTIWVVVMQKGVVAVGRAVAALGVGKRPDPELSEGDTRARA